MKKIWLALAVVILGAGGVYYAFRETDEAIPGRQNETVTPPPPASNSDSGHEVVQPEASPITPPRTGQTNPIPPPTKDAEENVDVPPPAKVFNIVGRNFAFSLTELRVKKGDVVSINFTSEDGFHDWTVEEFGAQTAQVATGGSASIQFIADKTGTFEYFCSIGNHRAAGMKGKLIVED